MNKAFTLVELVIVIIILAALAGAIVPLITSSRTDAQRAKMQADMEVIKKACHIFHADTGRWPLTIPELMSNIRSLDGYNGPYLDRIPVSPCGCGYFITNPAQFIFPMPPTVCPAASNCPAVSPLRVHL